LSKDNLCRTCRHWKPAALNFAGECRQKPPVVLMFSDAPETHYPRVNGDDWCSDWGGYPTCSGSYQVADHGLSRCQLRVGHDGNCGPRDPSGA